MLNAITTVTSIALSFNTPDMSTPPSAPPDVGAMLVTAEVLGVVLMPELTLASNVVADAVGPAVVVVIVAASFLVVFDDTAMIEVLVGKLFELVAKGSVFEVTVADTATN